MKTHFLYDGEFIFDNRRRYRCCVCGKPTGFVEINFEAPICCAECAKKITIDYIEQLRKTSKEESEF